MLGYKGKHFNTAVQEQKATLFTDIAFLYFVGNMRLKPSSFFVQVINFLNDGNNMPFSTRFR